MAQAFHDSGLAEERACFSMFVRHLPAGWGFLVAAGLGPMLETLGSFRFTDDDLEYLERTGRFTGDLLQRLSVLRFTGDVRAMPEGTPFFPHEPLLEVSGPAIEGQLVETVVLNVVHLHTLLASKAARLVGAAEGRTLVEFGLRRAHGADAGLAGARSSYLAGFASTSDVLAGRALGIPIEGTMAHSFVQAFTSELDAFRAFAASYPDSSVLLVDTYDTVAGVRLASQVGRELAARGHRLRGIRLDSGDLASLARSARAILDDAGLADATVFASGGLDEHDVARLVGAGAPIDGFGIGSALAVSDDAPVLDAAYKLVSFGDRPVLKLSHGKATWPGPKQVWRVERDGRADHDVIGLAGEDGPASGRPLLETVMRAGTTVAGGTLDAARVRHARERGLLPPSVRALDAGAYEVRWSDALVSLRDRVAGGA
jgi:nicotinate phosphoribosyltransferase